MNRPDTPAGTMDSSSLGDTTQPKRCAAHDDAMTSLAVTVDEPGNQGRGLAVYFTAAQLSSSSAELGGCERCLTRACLLTYAVGVETIARNC